MKELVRADLSWVGVALGLYLHGGSSSWLVI